MTIGKTLTMALHTLVSDFSPYLSWYEFGVLFIGLGLALHWFVKV